MNTEKLQLAIEAVQALSEEELIALFQYTYFPVEAVRHAFYTAQDVAELGSYASHKTVNEMASSKRHSPWKTVKLGKAKNGLRIFDKAWVRAYLLKTGRLSAEY